MLFFYYYFYSSSLSYQTKYFLIFSLSHSLFSALLSLTLVLLFHFCKPTLSIFSVIFITQILESLFFFSFSHPVSSFYHHPRHHFFFLPLSCSLTLGTNNKENITIKKSIKKLSK